MKTFLLILLIAFCIYLYANIGTSSRADVTHAVSLIPYNLGQMMESAANKIDATQK